MFGEKLMGFGGYPRDFSKGRVSDFSTHGVSSSRRTSHGVSLTEPGQFRVDPRDFGSRNLRGSDQNLGGGASRSFDGFCSARRSLLQNTSHGVSPADLRLLALPDSLDPKELTSLNNHRGSRTLAAAMEGGSGEVRVSSDSEDNLTGQGSCGKMRRYFEEDEPTSDLRLNLAAMISIYGSVELMAKDQIGCRFLQKLFEKGTFLDAQVIFREILRHVVELSMDSFGSCSIRKLLDVCTEEQRTLMVRVLTSRPTDLVKISLNTYGSRVVQKIIETVTTKPQIELVQSGLNPGFLTLVKDLNGNHVLQTCLHSLGPDDNKFVLEAATKHCPEIATHAHGCSVLQCCISSSVGEQHETLVAEIARHSLQLSQDPFGNNVVHSLIDQHVPAPNLVIHFRMHYAELATKEFSSHVVEKCLRVYPESQGDIVRELLSVPDFEHLLQDPFADRVIQTALSVSKGPLRARLVKELHRCGKLQSGLSCKNIFSKTILKKKSPSLVNQH